MKQVFLFFFLLPFFAQGQNENTMLGKEIIPFEMNSVNRGHLDFNSYPQAVGFVIVFICNHCPMAKLYDTRIQDLERKFAPQGVHVLAINPMDSLVYEEESWKLMGRRASRGNYLVPYIQDGTQEIARQFNAQHTPEVFIIWKEEKGWFVKYEGSLDDNGEHPELATPFVANALADLLEGKDVSLSQTPSFGCRIFYRKKQ